MRKLITSREVRDLLFMLAAIMLSILVCVTSIKQDNMFGVVVSIVLLGVLCIGFGYIFAKYEEKLFALAEKEEKSEPQDKAEALDFSELLKGALSEVSEPEKKDVDKADKV